MPSITFLPSGRLITVQEETTILEAALDNGIELNHNCGGFCACSTCHVIIEQGMENITEMEECEEDQLEKAIGITLNSRLGCQAKVIGDITVRIPVD